MFVLEDVEIIVPERIDEKNSNVDATKRRLDELAGLTSLDFDTEGFSSGFRGRPSFRDFGAFLFQPQNVVANPDILFYKADTYEHREKLRTIFPYVLNAITPDLMAKQHELLRLRRELRRKFQELSTVREVSERWLAEVQAKISEAKELGLVSISFGPAATKDELVDILANIVRTFSHEISVSSQSVSDAVQELVALQTEEGNLSLELSGFRKRLSEMSQLRESARQYEGALQIQRDRLSVADWLLSHQTNHQECPMCGSSLASTTRQLNTLYASLKEIEKTAGDFHSVPAAFDREFERVKAEIGNVTEKLRGVKIRIQSLERRSDEARRKQFESSRVSRFIGNLEQSLETYARLGQDSELDNEVQNLQQQVAALEREISEGQIATRVRRALGIVNSNAEKLLPSLDVERPGDPISLTIEDLTIKVQGVNREDYLWEIGSGSNWLSYHIAVSLGLHQFFQNIKTSPVPSFIVYDQPSQVYFPKRLASSDSDAEFDPTFRDEDIEAVKKVFNVLSAVVSSSTSGLQVIVLDHASDNVWGGVANTHFVEEWRSGKKLVPMDWLEP
jgi:hypothetical protein